MILIGLARRFVQPIQTAAATPYAVAPTPTGTPAPFTVASTPMSEGCDLRRCLRPDAAVPDRRPGPPSSPNRSSHRRKPRSRTIARAAGHQAAHAVCYRGPTDPGGMARPVAFSSVSPPGRWMIQVGAFATLSTAEAAAEAARSAVPDLLRTTNIELPATTPLGTQVAFRARSVRPFSVRGSGGMCPPRWPGHRLHHRAATAGYLLIKPGSLIRRTGERQSVG